MNLYDEFYRKNSYHFSEDGQFYIFGRKMIYVEQHILDPNTMMPLASCMKYFTSLSEFNSFYKLAKQDPCTILNILSYDPHENPSQKTSFDIKLYSMGREIEL